MRNKLYLTNPGHSDQSHNLTKAQNGFFDYKEDVEFELMQLNVPYETARVAVIDLKSHLIVHHRDKLTPKQAAVMIMDEVRRIYKVDTSRVQFSGRTEASKPSRRGFDSYYAH